MASILTTRLVKEYPGGVRGVDDVDVEIIDGEFFALLGPSGCGKTTLLRSIAGLEAITSGSLRIGDRDVTNAEPGARGVAMVFQDYALFPHMDVADNIAYPLRIRHVKRDERRASAQKVADGLSLQGLIERRPGQLSGGQQQRVALARAVATKPEVLLLDEPLSNLDARLRLEARTFLKELQRDLGVTTVFVTHDQAEALALADRIAVMREGKLQQIGTPRGIFQRPDNTFVASFIGSTPMNLIELEVRNEGLEFDGVALAIPDEAAGHLRNGQLVTWGVRPEYLSWADAEPAGPEQQAGIAAEVSIVENLGASVLLAVKAGGLKFQVVVGEDQEPKPGDRGWITPMPGKMLLFDAESTRRIGS